MRERYWFIYLLGLLAAAAALLPTFEQMAMPQIIIVALVLACLLTAKLLTQLLGAPAPLTWLALVLVVACVFAACRTSCLPLVALCIFDLASERGDTRIAASLSLVAAVLFAFIFPQLLPVLLATLAALVVAVFGAYLLTKLAQTRRVLAAKDVQLQTLEAKLVSQRDIISTIEAQGRAAERNRLATRIHDQVGHGMTGSILLLEAARLQMENDPQAARASMEKATENLRESVDAIRRDLREERADRAQMGLPQIRAALEDFDAAYPQVTSSLALEGALEQVPQTVWVCLYDSLQETLTNLLKHSSANRFEVRISLSRQLLTVSFGDNGGVEDNAARQAGLPIEVGMGLAGIEERCAFVGGRAFFSRTAEGFETRMTFPCKGGVV